MQNPRYVHTNLFKRGLLLTFKLRLDARMESQNPVRQFRLQPRMVPALSGSYNKL